MKKVQYEFASSEGTPLDVANRFEELAERGFKPGGSITLSSVRPFSEADDKDAGTTYMGHDNYIIFWRETDDDLIDADQDKLRAEITRLKEDLRKSHLARAELSRTLDAFNGGIIVETLRSYAQFARFFHERFGVSDSDRLFLQEKDVSTVRGNEVTAIRHGLIEPTGEGGYKLTKVGQLTGDINLAKLVEEERNV